MSILKDKELRIIPTRPRKYKSQNSLSLEVFHLIKKYCRNLLTIMSSLFSFPGHWAVFYGRDDQVAQ